jgi:hypothetical protein
MRNILLLLIIASLGIAGCNATTGASYPTGYNTPAAAFTLAGSKASTVTGYTCSGTGCIAVYTESPSQGVAVNNGTNVLRIYYSSTSWKVRINNGAECDSLTSTTPISSVGTPDVNGVVVVTLNGWAYPGGSPCISLTNGQTISALKY